jgi:hypothetical protein
VRGIPTERRHAAHCARARVSYVVPTRHAVRARYNPWDRHNNNTRRRMFYLKWTPSDLATLRAGALYTEVDEDGWVQRELGIGDDGLITHQLIPSDARPGWFGLVRLSFAMLDSNVTKAEFESLWHAGAERSAES